MIRETRLTYVLLAASFVLILISAYMLLTQARQLTSVRENLQAAERQVAQKQAQLLVLNDALTTNVEAATMLGEASETVEEICAQQGPVAGPGRSLCTLARLTSGTYGRFLISYARVAAQRAAAENPSDFAALKSDYAKLRPLLSPQLDAGGQWSARIDEGLAYAEYRLGNLHQAQQQVKRAAARDDRSAFVWLTALKIACEKETPPAEVRRMHEAALQALQSSVAEPRRGMNERYARLELDYFREDPELKLVCEYAGLPATKS